MIFLSLPDWLILLLTANLFLVFLVALYYAVRQFRRWPRPRATPNIFRCTVCGHVYLEHRDVPMAVCEKCGSMNENVKSV